MPARVSRTDQSVRVQAPRSDVGPELMTRKSGTRTFFIIKYR
jgi:hypothetical protein